MTTKLEQDFETWWEREGQEFLYALNTTTDDDIKLVAEIAWKNGAYCAEQAEQEPMAWMWACAECGTEAEDGTDCRICSSCGYHKFYKAPKVATCVCTAKTQEKVKQEPVTTDLMDMLRLIETIKYLRGIAERGLGREIRDDETIEQFVLGYVKQLEAAPVKPVKQEPLGYALFRQGIHTGTERSLACAKHWVDADIVPLYAAPVRTKDLTAQEKANIIYAADHRNPMAMIDAAIAADREKNK